MVPQMIFDLTRSEQKKMRPTMLIAPILACWGN